MQELLNSYKLPIAISLLGLVLLIGGIIVSRPVPKAVYPKESIVKGVEVSSIKVDISGAVNNPGVYSIPSDSRVEDVIRLAGGFDQKANPDFISKSLNLSQKLSDGQKIYIPFAGENQGGVVSGAGTSSSGGKPSLNSASEQELEALPGIGAVTAGKIISGRPYSSVDELLSKKVVSKSVYTKIQELITL